MRQTLYKLTLFVLLIPLTALATVPVSAESTDFPGRALYLGTPYIELTTLRQRFSEYTLVDVRSRYEYQTLHISNAVNIPLNQPGFVERVKSLRRAEGHRTLVMYCNGQRCLKSYKAAALSRQNGLDNIVVFDAGVLTWVEHYPELSVLLGDAPVDPANLIQYQQLAKKMISPKTFVQRAQHTKSVVIDVRDMLQREGITLFIGREHRIELDEQEQLKAIFATAKQRSQSVLIYDHAGKQVPWLMYYLQSINATNYYFMQGGMDGFYKTLAPVWY